MWVKRNELILRMYIEKGKNGRNMFGNSLIVLTRFDLKVSSEYKNILSKLLCFFLYEK